MLFQKVNSISTYSAGNAVSKGKLDICESADSGGKDSLGDAKIFFNFGCPKGISIWNRCYRNMESYARWRGGALLRTVPRQEIGSKKIAALRAAKYFFEKNHFFEILKTPNPRTFFWRVVFPMKKHILFVSWNITKKYIFIKKNEIRVGPEPYFELCNGRGDL